MIFNSSHAVLGMIFGFLGKFWVGEVKNILKINIFSRRIFFSKKSKKYFSRPKIFEKQNPMKKSMKMKISKFREKIEKIEISKFDLRMSDWLHCVSECSVVVSKCYLRRIV